MEIVDDEVQHLSREGARHFPRTSAINAAGFNKVGLSECNENEIH